MYKTVKNEFGKFQTGIYGPASNITLFVTSFKETGKCLINKRKRHTAQ